MKERFLNTFANIPLNIRKTIIYVDDDYGAMTWLVLWLEVKADTEVARKALEFLSATEII